MLLTGNWLAFSINLSAVKRTCRAALRWRSAVLPLATTVFKGSNLFNNQVVLTRVGCDVCAFPFTHI